MQASEVSGSATVRALRSSDLWEQEAGLRAVINFAYEERNRGACGALSQPISALLQGKNRVINMFAAWALANICLNSAQNRRKMREEPGLFSAVVRNLSSAKNELTLQKHLHLVINLTIDDPANRQALAKEGLVSVLLTLLEHDYRSVRLAAANALVNLLYEEPVQQLLVSSGGLEKLMLIYDAPNPDAELQPVVSSILVTLTAFDSSIRSALLKADILSPLNRCLMLMQFPELQKSSVLLLYNLLLDEANERNVLDAGTVLPCALLLAPSTPRPTLKELIALFSPFSQNEEFRQEFRLCGGVPRLASVLTTLDGVPASDPLLSAMEDLLTLLVNMGIDDKSRKQLLESNVERSLTQLRQSGRAADHDGLLSQALSNLRIPVREDVLQQSDVVRKAPSQLPSTPRVPGMPHASPFEEDEATRFTLQSTPSDQLSLLSVADHVEASQPQLAVTSQTLSDTSAHIAELIARIEAYSLPTDRMPVFDFPALPPEPASHDNSAASSRRNSVAGWSAEPEEHVELVAVRVSSSGYNNTTTTPTTPTTTTTVTPPAVHVVAPLEAPAPVVHPDAPTLPPPQLVVSTPAITLPPPTVPPPQLPVETVVVEAKPVPPVSQPPVVSVTPTVPSNPTPAQPLPRQRSESEEDVNVTAAFSQAGASAVVIPPRPVANTSTEESPSGSRIKRDKEKRQSTKRASRLLPEDVTASGSRVSTDGKGEDSGSRIHKEKKEKKDKEGSRIHKEKKEKEGSRIHKEKKEKREGDSSSPSGSQIKKESSGSRVHRDKDSGSQIKKEKKTSRRESVALPSPQEPQPVPQLREAATSAALALPRSAEEMRRPVSAGRSGEQAKSGKERSHAYVDAAARAAVKAKIKRLPPEEEEKINNRRFMIATEILTTERFYVSSLSLVIRLYLEPLSADAKSSRRPMIPPEDVPVIFSGWEIIHRLNQEFLKRLEERMKNWRYNLPLGDLFQALAPTIRFYSSFITAYDKAVQTLELHCAHNKRLRQYLYETHRLPECRSLDLAGFLIMPIQRVPRYNLLLSDLVKSTPEYYDDFPALNLALERMKEVASYLNEVKRRAEDVRKIISIQESLIGYEGAALASLQRAFVKEGTLLHHTPKGPKYTFLFLFTDILLLAKQIKSRQYKYTRTLPLAPLKFEIVPANEENKFAFRVLNGAEELLLYTTTEAERRAWLDSFPKAIQLQKSMHATAAS